MLAALFMSPLCGFYHYYQNCCLAAKVCVDGIVGIVTPLHYDDQNFITFAALKAGAHVKLEQG